jgi:hypothetical protein
MRASSPPAPFNERQTLPLSPTLPPPRTRMPEHTPTGPHLPIVTFPDIADAPTHITGLRAEREDPTDVSSPVIAIPPRVPTAPPQYVRPVSRASTATSSATRTWFLLCALFAVAVTVAILIAVL